MKIIVDAMGGDNAPLEIVKGAVMAAEEFQVEVILTGRGEEILKSLQELGMKELPAGIEIAHASEVVHMEDDPVAVMRTKKDSSMSVGLKMLKDGAGDAMVSAGNTGALLSGSTLMVKRVSGIRRAALAPFIPNSTDGFLLIDCGANLECTPEHLLQFAFMGSYYVQSVAGKPDPRIGLLNIGTEETKGTELQREVYQLLEAASREERINFIGNVEARDVMTGACDVVVCDGFTGNILLKSIEGTGLFFNSEIRRIFMKNWRTKIAALLVKDGIAKFKKKMDSEQVGGTALLGISKPVIKAHGSSKALAIRNAVRQAIDTVSTGVIENIQDNIDYMKIEEDRSE